MKENQVLLSRYFGGSTLKEIGQAFKRIDVDGSASLSWEEFVAAAGLEMYLRTDAPAQESRPPDIYVEAPDDVQSRDMFFLAFILTSG